MKIKKLLKTLNYNFYKCAVCYDEFNVINDHTLGRKRGGFIYIFYCRCHNLCMKGDVNNRDIFSFWYLPKRGKL